MNDETNSLLTNEVEVASRILHVRGQKVMIDSDLAELFGITTKRLNEQVKRNAKRFPTHFMFVLSAQEKEYVVANCDHLKKLKFSPYLPSVFTEHGIIMLSSVLNSERAIQASVKIVEVFIKMREMLLSHKELFIELESVRRQLADHENKFLLIFEYLKQFEEAKHQHLEQANRRKIGYKNSNEEDE